MTAALRTLRSLGAIVTAFLAASACTATAPARAQPPWQSLDLSVAARNYDGMDPVEDQTAFGLEYVAERPGDDFGWGIGVSYSGDEDSDPDAGGAEVEVEVLDLSLGLRRTFDVSEVARPYVGLGLTLLSGESRSDAPGGPSSDDDVATGFHLRAGSRFDLSPWFHVGVDARWVFGADLDLAHVGGDGDSGQLALFAGFSF